MRAFKPTPQIFSSPSRKLVLAEGIVGVIAGALIGVLLGSVFGAHSAGASRTNPSDNSSARKSVTVTAAFYPLADAVTQVGGKHVKVTNLTPAGVEPHDLELTPKQVESVLDADLAVVVGNRFQPAVEDVAADRDGPTLNVLEALPIGAAGKKVEPGAATAFDPHVWLDPVLYEAVVNEIAAALSKVDPTRADEYTANAAAYNVKLAKLDDAYKTGLANCERDLIITAHESFARLAARYGLQQEGIAGISSENEPNPRRLAELATRVEKDGITTIFTEDLVSPKVARTLAREAGVKTATLNPLEGLTPSQVKKGATYISEMEANLRALQKALGCSA